MTSETGNLLGKSIPPVNDIMIHPSFPRRFLLTTLSETSEFRAPTQIESSKLRELVSFWNLIIGIEKKFFLKKNFRVFFYPPPFPSLPSVPSSECRRRFGRGGGKKNPEKNIGCALFSIWYSGQVYVVENALIRDFWTQSWKSPKPSDIICNLLWWV